jgi:hypothetical protein
MCREDPMADGFTVDLTALDETAHGIKGVIDDLGKLGISEQAEVGRGFAGLSLNGLQVGYTPLQSALAGFFGRWQWGVRTLVQDGNEIAQRLGLAVGMYYDAEQTVTGAAKDIVDAAVGDPHLTDEQVEHGSWAYAAGLTPSQAPNTFSGQAWAQAGHQMAATWKAEGEDILKNGPGSAHQEGTILP